MPFITEMQLRASLSKGGLPNPYVLSEGCQLTPAARDFLQSRGITVGKSGAMSGKQASPALPDIPIGVSNRHIHLSVEHIEKLFGPGYALSPLKELSQRGQFAAKETVSLAGPKGMLKDVRILGPSRGASQVEISRTDGFQIGIHPPLRLSGVIADTPGIAVYGPKGFVYLEQGVIVAKAHIHMSPGDAQAYGVKNGNRVQVRTHGQRPLDLHEVVIRVDPRFSLDLHIDTDEANAGFINQGDRASIIGLST
ncbi:phosphate propanoyltransferase [Paenibacillus herberti]|uniref:Phosphate propanoyltransferase n=1 Tax=Paenibacillus herberti TaxID=1619309 RepID=A0A229NUA4_9BACL|nr:phosphate propanoyltransferase [Paenibacillus herberti]OXM13442.1 propanediol utilization protein [Paenibacillus herberti]